MKSLTDLAHEIDRLAGDFARAEVEFQAARARRNRAERILSDAHDRFIMHPERTENALR